MIVVHDVKVPKRVLALPPLPDADARLLRALWVEMLRLTGSSDRWIPVHPEHLRRHSTALWLVLQQETP